MSFLKHLFKPSVAKLKKTKNYPALIALLLDKDTKTVNNAYNALYELGKEDPQPVIDALDHESDAVSRYAFEILEYIGPLAVDHLARTVADTDEYRSRISVWLLGNISQKSNDNALRRRVADLLIKAMKYKNGTLRQNAASALGKLKDPRAINILAESLLDSHAMSANNAAWAIAEIAANHAKDCEVAIPNLIKLLRHENKDVSKQADFTISWIGLAAVDALVEEYKAGNAASLPIVRERLIKFDAIEEVEPPAEQAPAVEQAPAAQPAWVAIVENNANVAVLIKLCNAYAANDRSTIAGLEPQAKEIGKKLDAAGGLFAMRKMFDKVAHLRGCRTLEMHWGGIGDWRA